MKTSEFDYELPTDRIAQEPATPRDSSGLLLLDRRTGKTGHGTFRDIADILRPGDLVVLNDTRVIPAAITMRRATGARIEALLAAKLGLGRYEVIARRAGRLKEGEVLDVDGGDMVATAVVRAANGRWVVEFGEGFEALLPSIGRAPLPPYIKRGPGDGRFSADIERYQTIYATEPGSIAAPTAGLHFTNEVLAKLESHGVELARITLSVGPGTFLPVTAENVANHVMELEEVAIGEDAAGRIRAAKSEGRRVVAVGTTTVRSLEWAASRCGKHIESIKGEADLFIYPGYQFKVVDVLLTNFHLPRSTLIMLVSAFAGRENVLAAYGEAIDRGYRFYSYGDAMLIS